jgi:hypothetical protein
VNEEKITFTYNRQRTSRHVLMYCKMCEKTVWLDHMGAGLPWVARQAQDHMEDHAKRRMRDSSSQIRFHP